MTEYLCLTLVAHAGESEAAFKSRLTAFWTHLLRTQPDTYEAVFAEAKEFETSNGCVSRAYMVGADAAEVVASALAANGLATLPLDPDDTYSKYEASGSEWFQIRTDGCRTRLNERAHQVTVLVYNASLSITPRSLSAAIKLRGTQDPRFHPPRGRAIVEHLCGRCHERPQALRIRRLRPVLPPTHCLGRRRRRRCSHPATRSPTSKCGSSSAGSAAAGSARCGSPGTSGKGDAAVKFCTDPAARHQLVTHEQTVVARVMKHGGDHPNVVPLLECNLSGDIPWLMYEYVEGGTLAETRPRVAHAARRRDGSAGPCACSTPSPRARARSTGSTRRSSTAT